MAVRSSERNQFRYHLALSTLYSSALLLADSRANESRSLVARLIKCEIPLSSFAFVNSSYSGSLAFLILGVLSFRFSYSTGERVVSTFAPSRLSSIAHISRTATPFLGRVRRPWRYIATDVDIAWHYPSERRADICLTLIGKCFDLLSAFSALSLSCLDVGAR